VEPALLDSIVKAIGEAYAFFDSLQISVTTLVVCLVVATFGFFFALREAATWFLKIDDLKSDVRRLKDLVLQMEGEVRVLQSLIANEAMAKAGAMEPTPLPETETAAVKAAVTDLSKNAKAFPITH